VRTSLIFEPSALNGRFDTSVGSGFDAWSGGFDILTGGDASTGNDACSGGLGIGDDTF
jgi:hypothetical protein